MEYKDYYKILGVARDATADEIKKSYRKLARKYHPDVSSEPNAEEKFKEVKEAYDVLKNAEKRAAYDRMGNQWQEGQTFKPPPDWQFQYQGDASDLFEQGGYSDFFETLFGRGAQARGFREQQTRGFRQRGLDQHSKLAISLEEAYRGTERTLTLQEPEIDPRSGQVQMQTRTLKVKIPAGVTSGQQIRLAGQGGKGLGGEPNGDLYLEIQISPHPFYTIEAKDVFLNLPVTPWEAALGAAVMVPTLGGNVELKIPAGSQTGQKLRLKGRGLPGHPSGDQYILLKIYIPEAKTEAQRGLYEQMAQQMSFDPRKNLFMGTAS